MSKRFVRVARRRFWILLAGIGCLGSVTACGGGDATISSRAPGQLNTRAPLPDTSEAFGVVVVNGALFAEGGLDVHDRPPR